MTFSLVARDRASGAFGIVVCSSSPAVASRCAHPRSNVGVVASQNVTNPALGPRVLDSLAGGSDADAALDAATGAGAIPRLPTGDRRRRPAATPRSTPGPTAWACTPTHMGDQAVAAGNLLKDEGVITALLTGYADSTSAAFEERLLDGLRAAAWPPAVKKVRCTPRDWLWWRMFRGR